ncbi:MAG: tetratricopeptide repeat protein, partial [Candidatus Omnitrophica bacterium]|nr:tetratricopeptide repeat protein [Candidatus Omnitrophota bacterium]
MRLALFQDGFKVKTDSEEILRQLNDSVDGILKSPLWRETDEERYIKIVKDATDWLEKGVVALGHLIYARDLQAEFEEQVPERVSTKFKREKEVIDYLKGLTEVASKQSKELSSLREEVAALRESTEKATETAQKAIAKADNAEAKADNAEAKAGQAIETADDAKGIAKDIVEPLAGLLQPQSDCLPFALPTLINKLLGNASLANKVKDILLARKQKGIKTSSRDVSDITEGQVLLYSFDKPVIEEMALDTLGELRKRIVLLEEGGEGTSHASLIFGVGRDKRGTYFKVGEDNYDGVTNLGRIVYVEDLKSSKVYVLGLAIDRDMIESLGGVVSDETVEDIEGVTSTGGGSTAPAPQGPGAPGGPGGAPGSAAGTGAGDGGNGGGSSPVGDDSELPEDMALFANMGLVSPRVGIAPATAFNPNARATAPPAVISSSSISSALNKLKTVSIISTLTAVINLAYSVPAYAYQFVQKGNEIYIRFGLWVNDHSNTLWSAAAELLRRAGISHPTNAQISGKVIEIAKLNNVSKPDLVYPYPKVEYLGQKVSEVVSQTSTTTLPTVPSLPHTAPVVPPAPASPAPSVDLPISYLRVPDADFKMLQQPKAKTGLFEQFSSWFDVSPFEAIIILTVAAVILGAAGYLIYRLIKARAEKANAPQAASPLTIRQRAKAAANNLKQANTLDEWKAGESEIEGLEKELGPYTLLNIFSPRYHIDMMVFNWAKVALEVAAWRIADKLSDGERGEVNLEGAIYLYNKITVMNPKSRYAQYSLGQAYSHIGNYDEAVKAFYAAISIRRYVSKLNFFKKNTSQIFRANGEALWALGKYDEASNNFGAALKYASKAARKEIKERLFYLEFTQLKGNKVKFIIDKKVVVGVVLDVADRVWNSGETVLSVVLDDGVNERSIRLSSIAGQNDLIIDLGKPLSSEVEPVETDANNSTHKEKQSLKKEYVDKANNAIGEGNHSDAIFYLLKARNLDPEDTTILFALGMSYTSLGDEEKAIDNFADAVRLDPEYIKVMPEDFRLAVESRVAQGEASPSAPIKQDPAAPLQQAVPTGKISSSPVNKLATSFLGVIRNLLEKYHGYFRADRISSAQPEQTGIAISIYSHAPPLIASIVTRIKRLGSTLKEAIKNGGKNDNLRLGRETEVHGGDESTRNPVLTQKTRGNPTKQHRSNDGGVIDQALYTGLLFTAAALAAGVYGGNGLIRGLISSGFIVSLTLLLLYYSVRANAPNSFGAEANPFQKKQPPVQANQISETSENNLNFNPTALPNFRGRNGIAVLL